MGIPPRPGRGLLLAGLVLSAAMAGCMTARNDDVPQRVVAFADDRSGYFSLGMAYDGQGVRRYDASISAQLNNTPNTGNIIAGGRLDTKRIYISMRDFAPADQPYRDGGVAFNIIEHGASGNGDTSIPRVDVKAATWGNATLLYEGLPFPTPTGSIQWDAHLMMLRDGVRDDTTRGILNRTGQSPYDPLDHADARVPVPEREMWIQLYAPRPTDGQPLPYSAAFGAGQDQPIANTNYQAQHPFDNLVLGSEANFSVGLQSSGVSLASTTLTFRALDPNGQEIGRVDLGGTNGATDAANMRFNMTRFGIYSVAVSGQATGASYNVVGLFEMPEDLVLNFWWEDVSYGAAAAQGIKRWVEQTRFEEIGGSPPPEPGQFISTDVDDDQPPGIDLWIVFMGLLASFVVILFVVKLVLDSVKGREFEEKFRKKD